MLPLIKINLLPYREALLAKKKKQFQTIMLAAALIGIGLASFGYFVMDTIISSQQQRVQDLQDGIKKLNDEIDQIAMLNQQRDNFIARQKKVEELSNRRFEAAYILDTLNTLTPLGLYVTSIAAQNPSTYIITGRAYSETRIANFMSALPGRLFGTPQLLNMKRVNNLQEFTLKVELNNNPGQLEALQQEQAADINSNSANNNQEVQAASSETLSASSEIPASAPTTAASN